MRAGRSFKRFIGARKGATAVEFALVALPFFLLLFATIETTTVFFAAQSLENATMEVARLVRTGQVQQQGITSIEFRTRVCDNISFLMTCDSKLQIDVRTFDSFQNVDFTDVLDGDGNYNGQFVYEPGAPGAVVLVRVFYAWPILTPVVDEALTDMAGSSRLLTASAAFRNEPFD